VTIRKTLVLVPLTIVLLGGIAATQETAPGFQILEQGVERFSQGDYRQAMLLFRELLLDPEYDRYQGDAYFWIAKSALGLSQLEEASRNLEFFLANYPGHPNYEEGRYQRGRLLFLQGDHEAAIQVFSAFVEEFPASAYVANAIYWSGESLFALGRFDEAQSLFARVIQEFPRSHRVEAARYRLSLIDLTKRENELLKLLRWSHEEYLQALEEFERQERSLDEAVVAYQQSLARQSPGDFRSEIARLQSVVSELRAEIARKEDEIRQLQFALDGSTPIGGQGEAELLRRSQLLDIKEQTLRLKEELLLSIENQGGE
jgi:TolA-binding protein